MPYESSRLLGCQVARHGVGYDNLDFGAAKELGIWATYSPDTTSLSVAEVTITAMLSIAKKLEACSRQLQKGNFPGDCFG